MSAAHFIEQLPATSDPVRSLLRGSVLIVEAALNDGLPTPVAVYVDMHAVQVTLESEDAFNAWATWLDTPVDPYPIDANHVYYSGRTEHLGVRVVVQWTEISLYSIEGGL